MGGTATVDAEAVRAAKMEIQGIVQEIAALSKSDIGAEEFYEALLNKVVQALAAIGGAVWTIAYSFFFKAQVASSLFLVLVVGPNLVSRDLRFNALPLYFSRPLRRFDYFLGKLGVIGYFLAAIAIVPAAAAYLLHTRISRTTTAA